MYRLNSKYDKFVCGSDQIWSPNLFDENYFLKFVDNPDKKIAYAPSFGVNEIVDDELKINIGDLVKDIGSLSIREDVGVNIIKDIANRDAKVVLDPTLLLEKEIWKAADLLRGNLDASEYKSVVLGLIFLKYISDRFEAKYNELVEEGDGFEEDKDEYTSENIFFVPQEARWAVVAEAAHTPEVGTAIDNAMRLIEKENPRLKGILPKNFATRVLINCEELKNSTERALLMARESKSNRIKLMFANNTLTITANSEKGNINDEIEIQLVGKDLEIAFNATYIQDVMRVLDDECVYLNMNNAVTPCVIVPVEGEAFYYMILPVRLFTGA